MWTERKKKMPQPILIFIEKQYCNTLFEAIESNACTCWTSITNKNMSFKNSPYPYNGTREIWSLIFWLKIKTKYTEWRKKNDSHISHYYVQKKKKNYTRKTYNALWMHNIFGCILYWRVMLHMFPGNKI